MDPGTMMLVASAVRVGQAGMQAYGEYQEARGARRLAEQAVRVSQMNASQSFQEGSAAEEAQRRVARQQMGSIAASYAQSGGGTDLGAFGQEANNAELDALNIRYEAETKRQAYLQEAEANIAEVRNAKRRAKAAVISGITNMGAAALQGASDYSNMKSAQKQRDMEIKILRERSAPPRTSRTPIKPPTKPMPGGYR